MKKQNGFTVIEVVIALVLSGVVALLAYGTMQAGFDSRDRLDQYRRNSESVATLRTFLVDALRHPADASESGYPSFVLSRRASATGVNADGLRFVSRGVTSPLGAGTRWLVTVTAAVDGLHLSAEPLDDQGVGRIASVVPGIRGVRIQVMGDAARPVWRDDWTSTRQAPAAVRIELTGADGAPVGAPLVVLTSLERVAG